MVGESSFYYSLAVEHLNEAKVITQHDDDINDMKVLQMKQKKDLTNCFANYDDLYKINGAQVNENDDV